MDSQQAPLIRPIDLNVTSVPVTGLGSLSSEEWFRREIWQHRAAGLSLFITRGHVYLAYVGLSLILLLVSVISSRGFQGYKTKPHESADSATGTRRPQTPLKYAVTQVVIFAATLCLALYNTFQDGYWMRTLAVGYVLLLGVLQFVWRPGAAGTILSRHMNWSATGIIFLEIVRLLVPLIIIDSQRKSTAVEVVQLFCLICALLVAFAAPRQLRIREPNLESPTSGATDEKPSPEETCSWFSYYISYEWITYLTIRGFSRDLAIDDLPPLPSYDTPTAWLRRMREARLKGGKTLKTLCITFRNDIRTIMVWSVMTAMAEYLAPCATYFLLGYLENPDSSTIVVHPFLWIALLFIGPMTRSVCYQRSIFTGTRLLVRVKATMIQEIYQVVMQSQSDNAFLQSIHEGDKADDAKEGGVKPASVKVESILSYDADAIANASDIFYALTASTVSATIAMTFLYQLLGWPSLVGVAVLLSLCPLPALFSGRQSRLHRTVMEATDARLSRIAEYLQSIRTLKFFAWEEAAARAVDAVRATEQRRIWRRNVTSMLIAMTGDMLSLVGLLAMFASLVLFTDTPLRAPAAFTALALTETLRTQFVWLSKVAQWVAQGWESLRRVDRFFESAVERKRHPVGPPELGNATFRVSSSSSTSSASFRLRDVSVSFREKALNVVTGPTGSGKTSLLLSLLGETTLESGEATCPPDLAYVPQTAWLESSTIRDNVLFYSPYDERRYRQVIYACDLAEDIAQLPLKDRTRVGEQGSSLSGGQKQRVSLARALYSNSSTLLLDDIFSALDARTTLRVYERCFRSGLLSDRTVILVTHYATAVEDAAVAVSLAQGKVLFTKINTNTQSNDVKSHWVTHQEEIDVDAATHATATPRSEIAPELGEPMTDFEVCEARPDEAEAEHRSSGRVPRQFILRYMYLFGGYITAGLTILNTLLVQLAYFSITFWLSIWTGQSARDGYASNATWYLLVYAGAVGAFVALQVLNNYAYQRGGWRAARTMHARLVAAVFGAPARWHDGTPVGRVLNRFGVDVQSLDSLLVDWLRMSLDNGVRLALRLVGIASIMPVFAAPAAFFCLLGFGAGEVYARAQISVKRLCAVGLSPVFSHFGDAAAGLAVVRARRSVEDAFAARLAARLALYMRALETQYNCNRWVSVRSDLCAAAVAVAAGCIAYGRSGDPGLVGFSLSNAIGLSQTILTLVRNVNELEVELNSFQRVAEYAAVEPEADPADEAAKAASVPAAWPASGGIEFRNVTARYALDGPDILRDVTFRARPGQRVAIIGRTGSGKSTITRSLLRSTDIVAGNITIEGVDVRNIPLKRLRESISFVPQDSVIFSGDIRSNLDPFGKLDEAELQKVLEACNLIQTRSADDHVAGPGLSTSTLVAGSGKNFSSGQRQILGLARAICRRSKVVILDEATASVDHETDMRMQQLIRSEFAGSTIVTIAHRLRTIIDYDHIIVMEEGKVLETGCPAELINSEGAFWGMLKNSGEYDELVALARL
ncbi:abc transporter [Hypoxylon sp. FL1284]|nr:abc transporter [Hypoxylon sp. FL1284]